MNFRIRKRHSVLLLLVFALLAVLRQPALHYPVLEQRYPSGLLAHYLRGGYETPQACTLALAELAAQAQAACPECAPAGGSCVPRLSAEQGDQLSVVALRTSTARLRAATVVVYQQGSLDAAAEACRTLAAHALPWAVPVHCSPPGVPRPRPAAALPGASVLLREALTALSCGLASWLACWALLRWQHLHAHLSLDAIAGGPQKFHAVPTPRVGGIPLFAGLLVGAALLVLESPVGERGFLARLVLSSLPAFAGGLVEDLTKRVGVTQRLLLTMAAGAMAAWVVGAVLARLAIPGVDTILKFYPVAVLATVVAVGGLANAFNIIDGYNGLAGGSAVLMLAGLAGLAVKTGDALMLRTIVVCAAPVLGFLAWNWPRGRIFLGDGGAYLLGFLLAELAVLLVIRNPSVSPWCAMMLMAHPVTETLYSIYRRRIRRGHHPGQPDALHLHQLVYQRLVRRGVGSKDPAIKLARNNAVAPYFWIPAAVMALLLQVAWDSSRYPVAATLGYLVCYLVLYQRLASWHAPRLLVQRDRPVG